VDPPARADRNLNDATTQPLPARSTGSLPYFPQPFKVRQTAVQRMVSAHAERALPPASLKPASRLPASDNRKKIRQSEVASLQGNPARFSR